jgi:hypothetical protein
MQNIEESLAALTFPEVEKPAEVPTEAPVVEIPAADAVAVVELEAAGPEVTPDTKKQPKVKTEAEEVDEGVAMKDGVSLEEMFAFKPEVFTAGAAETESDSDDKKKGKKKKKKTVELEFDENLGEVVGRKKHKRGEDATWTEE